MIYRDYKIHAIHISYEAWDIDDNGNEIEVDDEVRAFAGYEVTHDGTIFDINNVDIIKESNDDIYHVDGGFSSIADAKEYIDELEPTTPEIKAELEQLRQALREENISQGELCRLAELADYIEFGDVELLEPAGVPEGVKN